MFFVCAEVAELVDALGSGSSPGLRVGVRVSPSAPQFISIYQYSLHKSPKTLAITGYILKKAKKIGFSGQASRCISYSFLIVWYGTPDILLRLP